MKLLKFRWIILLLAIILLAGCSKDTSQIEEKFGKGIILQKDSAVVFFKSYTFLPENNNVDSTNLETDLSIFYYRPYSGKVKKIKEFKKIKNWSDNWLTHIDHNKNSLGFSIENPKKEKATSNEGIYLYNMQTSTITKIEDQGARFWISPDGNLVLYQLSRRGNDIFQLYGYDADEDSKSLYNENQPLIKNIEWLENGKAALLITEKEDSTIRIDIKN